MSHLLRSFETIHTTRKTVAVDESIPLPKDTEIAASFSQAQNLGKIAAIAVQYFKERGALIVMHSGIVSDTATWATGITAKTTGRLK